MTTTVHPRRALAEAEAAAWLELHADWSSRPACLLSQRPADPCGEVSGQRCPAEVRDTSVIGQDRPSGDGRSLPWYRMDGAFTGSPAPMGYVPQGLSDWAPGWERWYGWGMSGEEWGADERRGPAGVVRPATSPAPAVGRRDRSGWGESAPSAPIVDAPAAGEPLPLRGRALRAVGRQGTEQLHDVTVVLGQRVPASMLSRMATGTTRVIRASALDAVPAALRYDRHIQHDADRYASHSMADLSGYVDTSRMDYEATVLARLAAAELDAWCRERLTARQYQCLVSEDLSDSATRVARHMARRILDAELPVHLRGLRRVLA